MSAGIDWFVRGLDGLGNVRACNYFGDLKYM